MKNTPKTKAQLMEELKKLRQRICYLEQLETERKQREEEIQTSPIILNGKLLAVYGIYRDVTEQKKADEQIKVSLKEKEVLLREIHHRVKNNLQIINSLLKLQSQYIDDKRYVEMCKESQNRIKSMSLIHEMLYKSKHLSKINFKQYIRTLANYLFRSCWDSPRKIALKIGSKDIYLPIDNAIPCGLIINELVSNSLKHAFPEDKGWSEKGETKGQIYIKLISHKKNNFTLIIRDNGVGFPEGLDFHKTESLGLQLVNTLVEQLEGSIKLLQKDGTSFKIEFTPIKRKSPPR